MMKRGHAPNFESDFRFNEESELCARLSFLTVVEESEKDVSKLCERFTSSRDLSALRSHATELARIIRSTVFSNAKLKLRFAPNHVSVRVEVGK